MSLSTAAWGWPQWTYVVLIILNLIVAASEHGKPRSDTNAFLSFLSAGLVLFLLISGGFFA